MKELVSYDYAMRCAPQSFTLIAACLLTIPLHSVSDDNNRKVLQMIEKIATWASHETRIPAIYTQQGGWEGWLQVELAFLIPSKMGGSASREQHIYDPAVLGDQRVDLLWKPLMPGRPDWQFGIELKCQSLGQDTTGPHLETKPGAFGNAYLADLKKVAMSALDTNYNKNTVVVVLGFGMGDAYSDGTSTAKAHFKGREPHVHDMPLRVCWADTASGYTLFWAISDERGSHKERPVVH
jgi:hypothetical protein